MLYGITNELTRCLQSVQRIRGFTTMRYINRPFTYLLLTERCRQARDGQHRDAIISRLCSASCTGFLCGSASCSRLRPSSPGPCPATPPGYLADDCQLVADARAIQLRSADTRTLVVSRTRSSFGDRTFATEGPQVWNSLPPNLRLCGLSYGQFRRLLKTFLFGQ